MMLDNSVPRNCTRPHVTPAMMAARLVPLVPGYGPFAVEARRLSAETLAEAMIRADCFAEFQALTRPVGRDAAL